MKDRVEGEGAGVQGEGAGVGVSRQMRMRSSMQHGRVGEEGKRD